MGLARLPHNLYALLIAICLLSLPAQAHTDVTVGQAKDLIDSTDDLVIVDVREPYEYCDARGHIPGAVNYPWNSGVLQARYEELPMQSPILIVCRSGNRSNSAANFLDSKGFSTVYDMMGGMNAWTGQTEPCKYSGGSGTADDPYRIATAADLIALGETSDDCDKHFILTADIDLDPNLSGRKVFDRAVIAPDVNELEPGFQGAPFTGVFEGSGRIITNLTIVAGESQPGLFGWLDAGAQVTNLRVVGADITRLEMGVAGILAACNDGLVANCYADGTMAGYIEVGGLVGRNSGSLLYCCTAGSVDAIKGVGGLVGRNRGVVDNSYSTAAVTGRVLVAGLVGDNDTGGLVSNSYGAGPVADTPLEGSPDEPQGMGGLVGRNWGDVVNAFWDVTASGLATSDGGVGKTTADMQTATTFLEAGWDFVGETENGTDDIWKIVEGQTYPLLSWQKYGGGTGEPNDPYLIYTAEHLNALGAEPNDYDKHFKLTADIDLSGYAYDRAVIAPDTNDITGRFDGTLFTGVFDGNGHTISHLTIEGVGYLGLFGVLGLGGEICDLALDLADVNGSGDDVGGLVGQNRSGRITMSHTTGSVSGHYAVGGLVGSNNSSITMSYSTATVSGHMAVGGLVGSNGGSFGGSITVSFSTGSVSGDYGVGGLAGVNTCAYGFGGAGISNSYSTAAVSGSENVGGLVGSIGYSDYGGGRGSLTNCYSVGTATGDENIGGLVGAIIDGRENECFWDIETSGLVTMCGRGSTDAAGCEDDHGKTTAEMQRASTFLDAGWDFVDETQNGTDDIWWILEGQDYPRLWWEGGPGAGLVFVDIPGGTFEMGDHHGVGEENERPVHPVRLDSFRMSKYETTNAQYAAFLNAAMSDGLIEVVDGTVYPLGARDQNEPWCRLHPLAQIQYDGGVFTLYNRPDGVDMSNHPVYRVSWYGAQAFCDYYGYRLPTEAEWEYAARGGYHDPYYMYPWGSNEIDPNLANYGRGNPLGSSEGPYFTPVGYYGAHGAYGLCDMSGNVWEWCQDTYGRKYYSASPVDNPTGVAQDGLRVRRGGSWGDDALTCRVAERARYGPTQTGSLFGFRVCVSASSLD
jgi:formylglycine-generating enzyme required for sulfatase activity/rhodanese-related sulfurtransferase